MKKFFISDTAELNKEELQTGHISYRRLMNHLMDNRVLCNNVANDDGLSESIYETWARAFDELPEETRTEYDDDWTSYWEGTDIFQYFITDMGDIDYEIACDYGYSDSFVYSDTLDCWILLVYHWGTSWDYVMSRVEWSTNWEECRYKD